MTGSNTSENHVFFPGDHRLEGMLGFPEADPAGAGVPVKGGVVVAHPYPPHGATMAQPVVYRIAKSSRQHGLATLRFNFRGVGDSLGTFSGTEEHRDVLAALTFLEGELAALNGGASSGGQVPPLALAGYSFGSVMAARAAAEAPVPVRALALVGFAVSWGEFPPDTLSRLAAYRGPVLAVCAENDDLGYPEEVGRALTSIGVDFSLSVVEGAGHFLEGRHREVGARVAAFLAEVLGAES